MSVVVVRGVQRVDAVPRFDDVHVGAVVADVLDDRVRPRLEPLTDVDDGVGFEDVSLDVRPEFPAVSVLAERRPPATALDWDLPAMKALQDRPPDGTRPSGGEFCIA